MTTTGKKRRRRRRVHQTQEECEAPAAAKQAEVAAAETGTIFTTCHVSI